MKFSVGDKVRCINDFDTSGHLRIGAIYTIKEVIGDIISLVEENTVGWNSYRFALINQNSIQSPVENKMKVSSTGGLRDNKGKPPLSVVPSSLIKAVAQVIYKSSTEGGGKYPMHNWRKGLPWTDVADSAMRHIQDFLDRKDIDKESGLHTLYHAATNLAFLIEYLESCPQLDNRYKPEEKK